MAGKRVQVVGDLYHGTIPVGAVYIGRQVPGLRRSPYANPFKIGKTTPTTWLAPFGGIFVRDAVHACSLYRKYASTRPGYLDELRRDLRDKDVACWCKLTAVCHGDVQLDLIYGGGTDA